MKQLIHHRALYHEWNLKQIDPYRTGTAVNFYGAPGTGKSLAAEALAAQLSRCGASAIRHSRACS